MARTLLLCAFLLFGTSGCWVAEEIDKGMALMEEHTSTENKAKEKARAEAEAAEARPPAKVDSDYWAKARTITKGSGGSGNVVTCNLRGQIQFMTRDDCVNRGGQPK